MSIPAHGPLEPLSLPQFERRQVVFVLSILLALGIGALVIWPVYAGRLLSSDFLPHLYCYLGQPRLIWTHVVADSLIGLAYFTISGTILYLVYKGRRDIAY